MEVLPWWARLSYYLSGFAGLLFWSYWLTAFYKVLRASTVPMQTRLSEALAVAGDWRREPVPERARRFHRLTLIWFGIAVVTGAPYMIYTFLALRAARQQ